MSETVTKRIDDPQWLRGVRSDLDSKAEDWVAKTPHDGINKLEAIGSYLDVILTELGHPGRLHKCPTCGSEHLGSKEEPQ